MANFIFFLVRTLNPENSVSVLQFGLLYRTAFVAGIGTFWWSLHFKMDAMPENEKRRRKNPETDPILFVIFF